MEGRRGLESDHSSRLSGGARPSEHRQFGLVVGGAFLVLSALLTWRGHPTAGMITGPIGLVLIVLGLTAPARLERANWAWMKMAQGISRVSTPLLLGLVYFLVLTPTGLLLRLFSHRPLHHELDEGSYWVSRDTAGEGSDMTRQF